MPTNSQYRISVTLKKITKGIIEAIVNDPDTIFSEKADVVNFLLLEYDKNNNNKYSITNKENV